MDQITNTLIANAQNTTFQAPVAGNAAPVNTAPADSFSKSPSGPQLPLQQMNAPASVPLQSSGISNTVIKADTAIFLERRQDGTFSSTLKLPCDDPSTALQIKDAKGGSHFFYTSGDRHVINRLGEGGSKELEISLPGNETVGQMLYSEKEKALFVRTGYAVHRIDPELGTITDTAPCKKFGFDRSIGFDNDGNLLLGAEKKLSTLDGNLKEKSSIDIGFRPDMIDSLPGGHLICLDDSCPAKILIFGPDGKKVVEEQDGSLYSTIIDEKNRVFFIGNTGIGQTNTRDIVRFDPATGETLRFKGTKSADSIIPMKNDDILVFDDRLAEPRFINYDKDGHVKWNITFDGEGYARQFYLNEDESKAYIVVDSDKSQDRCLYEVDLKEESSLLNKAVGSLLSAGSKKKPKLLFTEHSNHRGMLPAVLGDGRIVICGEKAITLLDSEGKEIKQYSTSSELMKDLGSQKTVNMPFRLGSGSDFGKDDKIDNMLVFSINAQRRDNDTLYQRIPVGQSLGGCTFGECDKTLNWGSVVDEKTALSTLSMNSRDELQNLLDGVQQASYFNWVLSDQIKMPVGNAQTGNIGSLMLQRELIEVDVNGNDKTTFFVDNPSHFLTALPVVTGKRCFVFAGTDDGVVNWYDVNNKKLRQSYDVGEPVKRIIAGNNTVYAVTDGGRILTIRPSLEDDEEMGIAIDFSSSKSAVDEYQKPAVVDDGSEIDIDGIRLPKHGWAHIGGLRRK